MNNSPWAKLTTSMIPKISVRPEAINARIMPVTMPFRVWMMKSCQGKSPKNARIDADILDSEILLDDGIVDVEFGCRCVVANDSLFHNVDALARFQRQWHVLLHQ